MATVASQQTVPTPLTMSSQKSSIFASYSTNRISVA